MTPGIVAGGLERIRLRRVSRTSGVCEVRLPGVNVDGIWINEQADGSLTIRTPAHLHLQPIWREAIVRELSILWARS